ncbi:uncharacterized protein LOC116293564 isoform X2 [Actinia tenebrosa]|uniref:Uncharacterized protein LOC116293564 isoform X2 n=1 Tax=Actinia tenebrosa TaxID=6105 RepID=A0A6P8HPA6_ACTTE|nr:uncharacterized protein LOC116293564 isoform X2 [Actinia tenebrosa]
MATVLSHVAENPDPENSMDLDDSERGAQADEVNGGSFNFDSYIDEEFSNIFDSCGEDSEGDFEDHPNTNLSHSSRILAQQLQILKETNIEEVGASSEVFTPVENIQVDAANKVSLTTRSKDGEGVSSTSTEAQKYLCEKCHRLQSNSYSLDSGIGDGHKEDISYTGEITIRDSVVTDDKIIDILEELGTCWKSIGPILHINSAKLKNIDTDNSNSKDKASDMIATWKQQEGKYATVGTLEQALLRIKRKDVADKFIGVVGLESTAPPAIQHIDKPLNLNIKVGITTDYTQPDTSVLLCEDGSTGRKYIVKEVTDENHDWNVEKIVDDERVLERMMYAARNSRKTREERRQESLRRVSEELAQLRKRMRKVRIDSDSDDDEVTATQKSKQAKPHRSEHNRMTPDEAREMLRMCEFQSESSQTMYKVLIKLIGEVGPLEDNSRCLKQLSEFTLELRAQEYKLLPKLELLNSVKEDLNENQLLHLGSLKTWQDTQNKQVEGIEKLLTSLLEQGNIKWQRVRKQSNRRSEPIFNKLPLGGASRRRAKTDSYDSKRAYLSSHQENQDEERKKQISLPSNARQFKML